MPIPVTDAGPARDRLASALEQLAVVRAGKAGVDENIEAALLAEIDDATAELEATRVVVELASSTHADSEAVRARFTLPDGGVDWPAALPHYLAVLCVDEDLRDAAWWSTQLAEPKFGQADVDGLITGVMVLTADVVTPLIPKG